MEFKVSSAKDKIVVDRYKMAIAIVETEVEQQNLPLFVVIAVVLEILTIDCITIARRLFWGRSLTGTKETQGVPYFLDTT